MSDCVSGDPDKDTPHYRLHYRVLDSQHSQDDSVSTGSQAKERGRAASRTASQEKLQRQQREEKILVRLLRGVGIYLPGGGLPLVLSAGTLDQAWRGSVRGEADPQQGPLYPITVRSENTEAAGTELWHQPTIETLQPGQDLQGGAEEPRPAGGLRGPGGRHQEGREGERTEGLLPRHKGWL